MIGTKVLVALSMLAGFPGLVAAHDLSPTGTRFDRDAVKSWAPSWLDNILVSLADRGLQSFKESVHEEITHRAFGCNFEGSVICGNPDAQFATPYVIAGIRWNDDPPFQLNADQVKGSACKTTYPDGRPMTIRFITQPKCWASIFIGAERSIKSGTAKPFDASSLSPLPLRSHFGDLQFLHSMASADGESPGETRNKILAWAELTWGVVQGKYALDTWLRDIDLPVTKGYFANSGWRVQELLTLGDPTLRAHVGEVAFGSLLHMVQDSFAGGHVERLDPADGSTCSGAVHAAPGPIREFHSYAHQSSSKHAAADSRLAFTNGRLTPDVVDVARVLVGFKKSNASWEVVGNYLRCVYALAPDARNASNGGFVDSE